MIRRLWGVQGVRGVRRAAELLEGGDVRVDGAAAAARGVRRDRAPRALFALFALFALSFAACVDVERSRFGAPCGNDVACGEGLVCDPDASRCRPPGPPPEQRGLTCDAPLAATLDAANGLARAAVTAPMGEASPAPAGATCAGEDARWVYFDVDVDAPMVARISARGQGKVMLAALGDSCDAAFEHACAQGALVADVLLPLVEGPVRVAVAATAGEQVELVVEQVLCPPGFVPIDGGCTGFAALPGPAPRTRHALTLVDDRVLVTGGVDADGAAVDYAAFDRSTLAFAFVGSDVGGRAGHAAAALDGQVLLVGGADAGGELLRANDGRFVELIEPREVAGVAGGSLVSVTSRRPFQFVGGEWPLDATFDTTAGGTPCDDDFDCRADERCEAFLDDGDVVGRCQCIDEDCARLGREELFWFFDDFAPEGMRERRGHVAIEVDETRDESTVVYAGGLSLGAPAPPIAYLNGLEFEAWLELDPVIAPRMDVVAALHEGFIVMAGGVATDDDARPASDLVERWAPLTRVLETTRLARPRAGAAGALVGDTLVVVGGDAGDGPLASSELVDARTGAVRAGPSLPFPLADARAVTLPTGELLVVGGRTADGALADRALLLVRVDPGLVPPVLEPAEVQERPGDRCAVAIPLEGPSGTVRSNTAGMVDDVSVGADTCPGTFDSPAPEMFYALTVDAPATVTLVADDVQGPGDIVLYVHDACPIDGPCLAGDDGSTFGAETLTFDVEGEGAKTLFIGVDGYFRGPFAFELTWEVTP